jgi:hypothetical protein
MPNARRVIYSSYVVPIETETLEEGMIHSKLDTTSNIKKFAGKGSVVINSDQDTDTWTSMEHGKKYWEAYSHNTDTVGNFWEDTTEAWDGILYIANSSATVIRPAPHTEDIDFLYVKNTGSANTATLNLNNIGYDILIPPGAAVSMRVNDITSANIKVDTVSGATTIEYIIAKTS